MRSERRDDGLIWLVDDCEDGPRDVIGLEPAEAERLRVSLYGTAQDARRARQAAELAQQLRTVPVRIAVAVQDEGAWAAAGHAGMPEGGTQPGDARLARHALADLDGVAPTGRRHVVYVTASVPLPESVEVRGDVEPAPCGRLLDEAEPIPCGRPAGHTGVHREAGA